MDSYQCLQPHFDFALLDSALSKMNERAAQIAELDRQIAAIEEQGMVEASLYWRDDKYLYLIHPQRDGHRKREYIGKDPSKQQIAICKIQNYERWIELTKQRKILASSLARRSASLAWELRQIARW